MTTLPVVLSSHKLLQDLWPRQFLVVLRCVACTVLGNVAHVRAVAGAVDGILRAHKASRSLVGTIALEFGEVVQSISEAGHGRYIKLLASRQSLSSVSDTLDASYTARF